MLAEMIGKIRGFIKLELIVTVLEIGDFGIFVTIFPIVSPILAQPAHKTSKSARNVNSTSLIAIS
jgi:hypothetical protein